MNIAVNVASEKFEQFEWLTLGISAKSPNFEPQAHGTGEKPLDYQDRLGAIASMDTQLAKSVTALIVFPGKAVEDYEYVLNFLADIMVRNAIAENRREPEFVSIKDLAQRVAFMVLQFSLDPTYEENFTAKGRLHAAGLKSSEMSLKAYDCTWKQYEKLMALAIELAIDEASKSIEKYKKNTYKEMKN